MNKQDHLKPFKNFHALDGYHCQTNSFAKIYDYYHSPLSEDMLLGLGSGMGFIYWHQKGTLPFLGGRDNNKSFHIDIAKRTGVVIEKKSTTSTAKAEKTMIEMLNKQQPVMMFVDMGFLPCFDFGGDYHFGGHTHVVCGYDGKGKVLISEMDPEECSNQIKIMDHIKELLQNLHENLVHFQKEDTYEKLVKSISDLKNKMMHEDTSEEQKTGLRQEINNLERTLDFVLNTSLDRLQELTLRSL